MTRHQSLGALWRSVQSKPSPPGGLGPCTIAERRTACPEPASRIESAFLTALRQVDGYQLTATGGLVLTAGDSELIAADRALPD